MKGDVMDSTIFNTRSIRLDLNVEEARWLKSIMQNAIHVKHLDDEKDIDTHIDI